MLVLQPLLYFVESAEDSAEPGVRNPKYLLVQSDMLKDLDDHRDVVGQPGVIMSVRVDQYLPQVQLVDRYRSSFANSQLAKPTPDSFEVYQPLVIYALVTELEPSRKDFVSDPKNWFLQSRDFLDQLVENLHPVVLCQRNPLEHDVVS